MRSIRRVLATVGLLACVGPCASRTCSADDASGGTFVGKGGSGHEIAITAWQSGLSSEVEGFELEGDSTSIVLLHGTASRDGWTITEYSGPEQSSGRSRESPDETVSKGPGARPTVSPPRRFTLCAISNGGRFANAPQAPESAPAGTERRQSWARSLGTRRRGCTLVV
jgi:hypothetical protein